MEKKEIKQQWIDWFNNRYSHYLEDDSLNDYHPLDIMIDIIVSYYLDDSKVECEKVKEHIFLIIEKIDYLLKNNNDKKVLTDKEILQ